MIDLVVRVSYLYSLYYTYSASGLLHCLPVVLAYYTIFHWLPLLFGYEPLSGGDAVFLNDIPTNRQYILGTSIYERMTKQDFHTIMHTRTFAKVERFSRKITKLMGKPYWVKEKDFSVDRHTKFIDHPVTSEAELHKVFGDYISEPLDLTKSPWEAVFIENYEDDKSAIILKAHHALCDGLSAVSLLFSLSDPTTEASGFVNLRKKSVLSDLTVFVLSVLYLPISWIKRLTTRHDKSLIHGKALLGTKSYSCSGRIPISAIKAYSKRKNTTFNTAIMACIGSAVQNFFEKHNETAEDFTVFIPLSMRNLPTDNTLLPPKNDVSYLTLRFPTNLRPEQSRIEIMNTAVEALKNSIEPVCNSLAAQTFSKFFPMTIGKPMIHFLASQLSIIFTNVPGPNKALYFCKKRMLGNFSSVCGAGNCGVTLCGFSYDGFFTIGLTSDKALFPDARELLKEIEAELQKMSDE
jgi:diacylglycerol O-acyltransferase